MRKREAGFTLTELLITMVVFVLAIAAGSQIFTALLTQFKQQSKIAETNIEGIIGLEILKRDIEHAGYGLPWFVDTNNDGNANDWWLLTTYSEGAGAGVFNDGDPASSPLPAPGGVRRAPRAIFSDNNTGMNGSDYLVIKSINVARSDPSEEWTLLRAAPFSADNPKVWSPTTENLSSTDRVIVLISGGTTGTTHRRLIVDGALSFYTTYGNITSSPWPPTDSTENRIVYGVAPESTATLRMPFNRADYYIYRPLTSMPTRCAPQTGILYKGVMKHADGTLFELPLLDCVADMQVTYLLDANADNIIDWPPSDSLIGLTAEQIRDRVKEVRVYIVAQEGQRDVTYDFSLGGTRESITVTEKFQANSRDIPTVNLRTQIGDPEYKYYRWKLYTIVVKPIDLR